MQLEFFADDADVERLEVQLTLAGDVRSLDLLLPLAWQLRQRDPVRALCLVDEIERELTATQRPDSHHAAPFARLQLIRAEVHWLQGEPDLAQPLLDAALARFTALNDSIGRGDSQWLAASNWITRGNPEQRLACLRAAEHHFATASDVIRLAASQARSVFYETFTDPVAARVQWQTLSASPLTGHPWVDGGMFSAEAIIASVSGQYGAAARAYLRGYDAMLRCGNFERAAMCASNAGDSFSQLNDLASALEWGELALALARKIGSPGQISLSCTTIAEALRRLNRPIEAQLRLHEAQEALERLPAYSFHVNILNALSAVALVVGDAAQALTWAEQSEARAFTGRQREGRTIALCHQARALCRMGRLRPALSQAEASLSLAQETGNAFRQMEALRVLADLHRAHRLPAPIDMQASTASLHYLEQALTLGRGITGFVLAPELLDEVAADCATVGDLARAYALSVESKQALTTMHSKEATERATAMHVQREMQSMRAEVEHSRQLARAESLRLAVLEQVNLTLEGLGAIGRDITACLTTQTIFAALYGHVQGMLDAYSFAAYFVDAACETQTLVFGMESGQAITPFASGIDDNSATCRCIHQRDAVVMAFETGAIAPTTPTMNARSLMFAPLLVGERVLGIFAIQSTQPGAYGPREVAIFKSLAAYGAIALVNAETFSALQQAQTELQEKNKQLEVLAVTDRLTGLFNRLRLDAALEQELVRSERYASHFSIILLDIDKFKSVNDTHGHQVGDVVLVEVGKVLSTNVRKTDILGRWGGEEFLIVCSDTPEQATALAEKLRAALERHPIPATGPKTASFGVSSYRPGDTVRSMVLRADTAMYQAKESGRNRVEVARPLRP